MNIKDVFAAPYRAFRRLIGASTALSDLRNPRAWLLDLAMAGNTAAGVPMSADHALGLSAYFRALALISGDCAKLPLWLYARDSDGGRRRLDAHPITRLIHYAPNPEMGAFAFRETLTHYAMAWHGGFARIQFEGSRPVALWPVHPSEIRAERQRAGGDMPELVYPWQHQDTGKVEILYPEEVFHIHGLGPDGINGYSVATLARRSLGIAAATEEYTASFYGKGMWGSGILSHPGKLGPEGMKNLRTSFEESYAGTANAFRPFILEEGIKWERTALPAEDSQFLESRRFTPEDIATWFGIPQHKLGAMRNATYSNIEQQATEYVQDALMPWLIRWEQEIHRKLLGPRSGNIYAEHTVTALLRGDQAARATFYREMLNIGALSPNDIRRMENMDPIKEEGGDAYYMQSAMTTLALIVDPPEPPPPSPPQADPEAGPEADPEDSASGAEKSAADQSGPKADSGADSVAGTVTISEPGVTYWPAQLPPTDAVRGLFRHEADRVLRREVKAAGGAAKRYAGNPTGFTRWVEKFYGDQADAFTSGLAVIWRLAPGEDDAPMRAWVAGWRDECAAGAERYQRAGVLSEVLEKNYPEAVERLTGELMALIGLEDESDGT